MAGRPPKPKNIKVLEGNRSRREIPEEVPAAGVPVKPDGLCEIADAHWDFVTGEVLTWGVAKSIDAAALEQLCRYWALWQQAMSALSCDPLNKDARISATAYSDRWSKLAGLFGMSPVDRAKLAIQEAKKDEFEEFLKVTG